MPWQMKIVHLGPSKQIYTHDERKPLFLDANIYALPCEGENKKTHERCCDGKWLGQMRQERHLVRHLVEISLVISTMRRRKILT